MIAASAPSRQAVYVATAMGRKAWKVAGLLSHERKRKCGINGCRKPGHGTISTRCFECLERQQDAKQHKGQRGAA